MAKATARSELRSFVERIERLEEEKAELQEDIKSVYQEAKANGFDTKALKEVLRWKKADATVLAEHKARCEEYAAAIGILVGTPLGDAAMRVVKAVSDSTLARVSKVPPVGDAFPPAPAE